MKRNQWLVSVLVGLSLAAVGIALPAGQAVAEETTVDVGVTRALTEIVNAFDTAATQQRYPDTHGELVVNWTNLAGGDTGWKAPEQTVTDSVDTGWDMSDIAAADSSTIDVDGADEPVFSRARFGTEEERNIGADTVSMSAGDSVVRAVQVANLSNNYVDIDFSGYHDTIAEEIDQIEEGSFSLELFYEDGFREATDFDSGDVGGGITRVDGADGDIDGWTMGEVKTIYLVISADDQVSDGDYVESEFFITNNAPVHDDDASTSGDSWERGLPTAEDRFDTQWGYFVTEITGPRMMIDKRARDTGAWRMRPGDTVGYEIAIVNYGSDKATEIEVVDAIPEHTTYVPESAEGDTILQDNLTVEFESEYDGEDWDVDEPENVKKIRWTYDEIEYNEGIDPEDWEIDWEAPDTGERVVRFEVWIN